MPIQRVGNCLLRSLDWLMQSVDPSRNLSRCGVDLAGEPVLPAAVLGQGSAQRCCWSRDRHVMHTVSLQAALCQVESSQLCLPVAGGGAGRVDPVEVHRQDGKVTIGEGRT